MLDFLLNLELDEAGHVRPTATKKSKYSPARGFNTTFARATYIGNPGSRRYQRHLNRVFLNAPEGEITPEDIVLYTSPMTPLSHIFEKGNQRKWEPFRSVTENQQQELLRSMGIDTEPVPQAKYPYSSNVCYERIDTHTKRLLRKLIDDDFFLNLEKSIIEMLMSEFSSSVPPVDHTFETPYERQICHGICQYYNLHSSSVNLDDGSKRLQIKRTKLSLIPERLLSQHLQLL